MLNPFPDLLALSTLGPFILRAVIGILFIDLGILKFRGEKTRWIASFEALSLRPADLLLSMYALLQILGGILILVGLWTQVAALILAIFTGVELYVEWKAKDILKRDIVFYVLIFAVLVSLLLTGAGKYAIDIPL